jgi:hypothetical protein
LKQVAALFPRYDDERKTTRELSGVVVERR